jgi:hypothetical protein
MRRVTEVVRPPPKTLIGVVTAEYLTEAACR